MTRIFNGQIDIAADVESLPEQGMRLVREATGRSGLTSREEAEFLFMLDRLGHIGGHDWFPVAVHAMRDYVVLERRPTGYVTEADVDWLLGLIGDRPTAFGRAVVFAIVQEAEQPPPRLSEMAIRSAVGRSLLV